jgi:hypothetical protein
MSEWVWVDEVRPAAQLAHEVATWTAGGRHMATVHGIESAFEVWMTSGSLLVVEVTSDGPLGYIWQPTYSAALHLVVGEVEGQERTWLAAGR